jgi:serine/threonine protein kinase
MTEQILSQKYTIVRKVGNGSFGEVYCAIDDKNHTYAAKIEEKKKENCRILHEFGIYQRLVYRGMTKYIPKIYTTIETNQFYILIMQQLKCNLDEVFQNNKKNLSMSSIFYLAIEMISIIETIHKYRYIYRDIKPNNFMFDENKNLYIVDFGLAKQYMNKKNEHIPYNHDRPLIGTARYASVNMHIGIEPSRRDDLESIGYVLIYFAKGRLPWQGFAKGKEHDQLKMIGNKKIETTITELCSNLPTCFYHYIEYCRNLKFDEQPDYNYLKNLFYKCAKELNIQIYLDMDI